MFRGAQTQFEAIMPSSAVSGFNYITEALLESVASEEDFVVLMEEFSDGKGMVPFLHEFVMEECDITVAFNSDHYDEEDSKALLEFDSQQRTLEKLPPKIGARVRYEKAQMADRPNLNRRIYEFLSMIAAVADAHNRAKRGEIFILKGHPSPWTIPTMEDASGLLRSVEFDEKTGHVAIEIDLFRGTRALDVLESKGSLPISSRAIGKMSFEGRFEGKFGAFGRKPKKDKEGNDIKLSPWMDRDAGFFIMREFKFLGWDLVPGIQSVPGAIARPRNKKAVQFNAEVEATNGASVPEEPGEQDMTLQELKEKYPELVRQIEEAHGTTLDAVHAKALEAKEVELRNVVSSHETEFNAQGESLKVLEGSVEEKEAQVEELEKAISELRADDEPEELDPRVLEAMKRSEALEKELEEVKARQAKAEADAHEARMEMFIEAKLDESTYSRFADLLKPLIVGAEHVPATEEEAEESVGMATTFVHKILERYRSGKQSDQKPARGRPAHSERTKQQVALERAHTANIMGDCEGGAAYG